MKNRPKIRVESTNTKRLLEFVSLAGIVFAVYFLVINWDILPRTVPSHFGLNGRPDAYGDRSSLLLLPGAAVLIYILLTVADRYPYTFSYVWKITPENAYRQYQLAGTMLAALKSDVIWIFNYILVVDIKVSLGTSKGLSPIFMPILLGVVFAPICIYLFFSYRER